jgi:hypothetical protein
VDSDAMQIQQQEATPPTTTDNKSSINGVDSSNTKPNIDDEDEQAEFLNHCIERETIDFEKSVQDKRNATIDGKETNLTIFCNQFSSVDEPMPGKDANSPSITNQLRNEELERRKAVTNNYDMFATDEDYLDTNVKILKYEKHLFSFVYFRVPVHGVVEAMPMKMKIHI